MKPEELTLVSGDNLYYVPFMAMLKHLFEYLKHLFKIFKIFQTRYSNTCWNILEYFEKPLTTSVHGVPRDINDGLRFQSHPVIQKRGSSTIAVLL